MIRNLGGSKCASCGAPIAPSEMSLDGVCVICRRIDRSAADRFLLAAAIVATAMLLMFGLRLTSG